MEEVPQAVVFVSAGSNRKRHQSSASQGVASASSSWVAPQPKWGARRRSRSRSPNRQPTLPGLRKRAPSRLERRPACMPDLADAHVRDQALALLDKDVKAESTHESDDSRLRKMAGWLAQWGIQMYPPTLASVKALAASLKAGGYRSAHVYLSVYRVEAQRRGHAVDVLLGRHLQDY